MIFQSFWITILSLCFLSVSLAADMEIRSQQGKANFSWKPRNVTCQHVIDGKSVPTQFSPNKLTAAHATLPCGAIVTIINLKNKMEINVTINDRLKSATHIIDLSREAARRIDMKGSTQVEIRW